MPIVVLALLRKACDWALPGIKFSTQYRTLFPDWGQPATRAVRFRRFDVILQQGSAGVRRYFFVATAVATLLGLLTAAGPLCAQQQQQGTRIAVIDLQTVFKNHQRFQSKKDAFNKDADAYKAHVRDTQRKGNAELEKLKQFKPGTPEYTELEKTLAGMRADLQVETQLKNKEMALREAQIFYSAYNEVQQQVAKFSGEYGISMVLRFEQNEIDPANLQSVRMGLSRPVVYVYPQLDITGEIIKRLNAGVPPANVSRAPQVPRGRNATPPPRRSQAPRTATPRRR